MKLSKRQKEYLDIYDPKKTHRQHAQIMGFSIHWIIKIHKRLVEKGVLPPREKNY